MTSVTVVTCTGGRPALFALCQRWVERQTAPIARWVVSVDCGETPAGLPDFAVVNRSSRQGALHNLMHALLYADKDHDVVIMEDDDWYGPLYVEQAVDLLREHPIVQVDCLDRFHLPSSRFTVGKPASLPTKTVPGIAAFSKDGRDRFISSVRDGELTNMHLYQSDQVVPIKGVGFGLPGRQGATIRHDASSRKNQSSEIDQDYAEFRRRIGPDADAYLRLVQ